MRRGLTPEPGRGVLAPVGRGVEDAEGSSDMKIVAEEGLILYLSRRVVMRASLKPMRKSI